MTVFDRQPNCPKCGHEKFAIITHALSTFKNPKDGNDYHRQIELLCCERCKAVICQYDPEKTQLKLI